jgi:hypothetical protein
VRVYIFRNDAEALHAYTQDITGQNLPVSLTGVTWIQCGFIPHLDKLFSVAQAQTIEDVVTSRGFFLFKLLH